MGSVVIITHTPFNYKSYSITYRCAFTVSRTNLCDDIIIRIDKNLTIAHIVVCSVSHSFIERNA